MPSTRELVSSKRHFAFLPGAVSFYAGSYHCPPRTTWYPPTCPDSPTLDRRPGGPLSNRSRIGLDGSCLGRWRHPGVSPAFLTGPPVGLEFEHRHLGRCCVVASPFPLLASSI